MHIFWMVLLWLSIIIAFILLLMCIKIGVIWNIRREQDFNAQITVIYGFFKINILKDKTTEKAKIKKEKKKRKLAKKEAKKKKINLNYKDYLELIKPALRITLKSIKLEMLETKVIIALNNPADNAIVYGSISAIFYSVYTRFGRDNEKIKINITPDFEKGNGINFDSKGKIYTRVLPLCFEVLFEIVKDKRTRVILKKLIGGKKS